MVNSDGLRSRTAATTKKQASTVKAEHLPTDEGRKRDLAADQHSHYEFGGPVGTAGMILGFPCLMCGSLVVVRVHHARC